MLFEESHNFCGHLGHTHMRQHRAGKIQTDEPLEGGNHRGR